MLISNGAVPTRLNTFADKTIIFSFFLFLSVFFYKESLQNQGAYTILIRVCWWISASKNDASFIPGEKTIVNCHIFPLND